jgi:oleandomycin transport system permease protein
VTAVLYPAWLRHGLSLAGRGVARTVGSPHAFLDVTLQPVIFVVLFVYVFGGAIAGDTGAYLQFALPGVLVQTITFASAGTGTGLAEDRQTGIFDRFRSLPIPRVAPLLGAVLADLVRYATSGAIVLTLGLALGFRPEGSPLGVLAGLGVVILWAFGLCWAFVALGMLVRGPRQVQGLSALVTVPLTFGSNVFVPTETLPSWLRAWVEINPVTTVADAVRALAAGEPAAALVLHTLLWSAAMTAVFAPIAVALYRREA